VGAVFCIVLYRDVVWVLYFIVRLDAGWWVGFWWRDVIGLAWLGGGGEFGRLGCDAMVPGIMQDVGARQ
jgi:hypothetical protein